MIDEHISQIRLYHEYLVELRERVKRRGDAVDRTLLSQPFTSTGWSYMDYSGVFWFLLLFKLACSF